MLSHIKSYATRQNLEYVIFERFEFIRNLLKSISKSIAQRLIVQQQRYIKFIKYNVLFNICINDVRKHIMLLIDFVVAVKTFARYRICDISAKKCMNILTEHIRRSNKV